MYRRIISIMMSLALLAGVGWLVKDIFIDSVIKDKESRDLGSAYEEAYRLGCKANQLRNSDEFYKAGEHFIKAAERLRTSLKYNKNDPKASAIRKKMFYYYEQGIELYTEDANKQPVGKTEVVGYVYDGDTIKLANKEKVRYLGISSPEIAHEEEETDQPFGQDARKANSKMVRNKTVHLRYDGDRRGKQGRTLAYVFSGGRFINAEMLKLGLASYCHPTAKPLRYAPPVFSLRSPGKGEEGRHVEGEKVSMIKLGGKTGSYLNLLLSLIIMFFFLPLFQNSSSPLANLIFAFFFLLLILSCLRLVAARGIKPKGKLVRWTIFISAALGLVLHIIELIASGGLRKILILNIAGSACYSILLIIVAVLIIKDLFSGKKVTIDKIYGAVTAYLMLGLFWVGLYEITCAFRPGAIAATNGAPLSNYAGFVHFSLTTLTTLGYGDIVPISKLAMSLANCEAVVGQFFLAVIVARLVGLFIAQGMRERQ